MPPAYQDVDDEATMRFLREAYGAEIDDQQQLLDQIQQNNSLNYQDKGN